MCVYVCVIIGIIGDILKFSEKSFGTLQQQLSSLRSITAYSSDNNGENKQSKVSSKNSMESLPEIICRAAGALMVLNTAILGMANVRIVNTVKATAKPVSCGSCGKTGTVKEMLRCGRCKVMHYCNRAHQTLHWATHKVSGYFLFILLFVRIVVCSLTLLQCYYLKL